MCGRGEHMVSVVVPIYRVEKYLRKCVDSLLQQTYRDIEIILVDDGSPDACPEICDELKETDDRIVVIHKKNGGLSDARNAGIQIAKGTYITFIDSDDYVKPCYLERLYGALPADKTKEGVIVGSLDAYLPNGDFQTFHVPEQDIASEQMYLILTDLIDKRVAYAGSKLYDHRIIKQYRVGFVPFVSGLEDMLFMLDYLMYADFMVIRDYNNYVYRVGYSVDVLSVRINSFPAEYAAFSNFLERVYVYQKKFNLEDSSLDRTWNSLTVFFHKVILAIYKPEHKYTRQERLSFLHQVLLSDKEWIRRFFLPQYKADVLGKFLLCRVGASAFDGWMRFLSGIKFKKMFGAK